MALLELSGPRECACLWSCNTNWAYFVRDWLQPLWRLYFAFYLTHIIPIWHHCFSIRNPMIISMQSFAMCHYNYQSVTRLVNQIELLILVVPSLLPPHESFPTVVHRCSQMRVRHSASLPVAPAVCGTVSITCQSDKTIRNTSNSK